MKKISFNVKKMCKENGMTLSELAQKIGIAPESLSRSLNGNPQLSTLIDISEGLGVDVLSLFKNEDDINGIITYKGKTFIINSIKEYNNLAKIFQK